MTTIQTINNQGEAAFFVSLLQANGFEAVLLDEYAGGGNFAGTAVPIRLQVPEEQATSAILFLQAAGRGENASGIDSSESP